MEVKKRYDSFIEVNKSKFYAILLPLENEEDFKALQSEVRKEHKKAKHVVYAYRTGTRSKSSDDQEPKGTAGHPLMDLLYKKDLNNCVIFVARYFGGVKLGASRLLRTYLQAGINVVNLIEN